MFASFSIYDIEQKKLYFKLKSSFELLDINSTIGLYSIHKNGLCLYVGQSKNIPSRIATHIKGKYANADEINFYLAINNGYKDINDMQNDIVNKILLSNEMLMIKELKPIENIIADYDFELPENNQFYYFSDKDFKQSCLQITMDKLNIVICKNDEVQYSATTFMCNDNSYLKIAIDELIEIKQYINSGVQDEH